MASSPCRDFLRIRPHVSSYRTETRVMAFQGCVSTGMCERKRSMDGLERALESHYRDDV